MPPRWIAVCLICLFMATGSVHADPIGTWAITRGSDPFTGEARRNIDVKSDGSTSSSFRVQCSRGRPAMFVPGPQLVKYGEGEQRWIVIRIDSHPATLGTASGLKGTSVLATGISRQTYERLRDAKKIAVRIIETDNSTYDTVFNVRGTKAAMKAIGEVCPIETAGPGIPSIYDPSKKLPPVPERIKLDPESEPSK